MVLTDEVFRRSPVLSKLLRYLVDETIAGRSANLKSSVLAIDVLGHRTDFDSSHDSSARVQMVRLRRSLEIYYAKHTAADQLCIYVPAGTYSVRLGSPATAYPMLYRPLSDAGLKGYRTTTEPLPPQVDSEDASAVPPPVSDRPPYHQRYWRTAAFMAFGVTASALLLLWQNPARPSVQPMSPVLELAPIDANGQPELAKTAHLITNMFAHDLPQFKLSRIRIVERGETPAKPADGESTYRLYSDLVSSEPGGSTLYLSIDDVRSDTLLWSREVKLPEGQQAIADTIVPILGEINGPMGVIAIHGSNVTRSRNDGGYACLLKYFTYARERNRAAEDKVALCFEKPVDEQRMEATVLAARAMFAIERQGAHGDFTTAARAGTKFARAAVLADPNDGSANFAMARYAYLNKDCVSARFYTARTMEVNPNSPMFTATLAALAKMCDYPGAEKLLDQAFRTQSPHFPKGRLLLILAALAQDRPDKLIELAASDLPASRYNRTSYYLAESLIAASQGQREVAAANWKHFAQSVPAENRTIDDKLSLIVAIPEMRSQLIVYLKKGGAIEAG